MNLGGLTIVIAGVWLLTQLTKGDLLHRLKVLE